MVKRVERVVVGGISATLIPGPFEALGVEVVRGLLHDAEYSRPDYTLLKEPPKYSITHTSRGCVRSCGFCMVHRLEPHFRDRPEWYKDLHPKAKKVYFFDNNWLAKDYESLKRDTDYLRYFSTDGQITSIDFNQGLDARLMTEEKADLLKGLPLSPVRFAFDGMHEDGVWQEAVKMMAARGHREFRSYVLFNFNDAPEDLYYRLREHARISEELHIDAKAFPMRYQPILEIDQQRDYTGKHWTPQTRKGFFTILASGPSANGLISVSTLQEFEYWFGKDEREFVTLLQYPKLKQLCNKKRANLRMKRADPAQDRETIYAL